ncbi:MAG: 30S ribosomal protein S6 [Candidatus Yanofskybacteria bacterium GW2011_GWF1_44_227]|uniref:Small ribosomal subunit protein bS6 n=1 Tax=Candidatus Yanofskybacteria bacterium GW2011_GWE2_40_11 TaxID=1619033 RepID=A0A0G0QKM4_9BACT|nr:MAG: 30S ribosomal protein S6 [Candidatus Yanofskybacteria bacterium GW2011_GWE2_40_11]KKT15546.1 MAG: 30S ribosomal protein S6 [Candidatus Yanofskybacteria bacterium GW2011_GWF2_43_596]KKT53205.1 MAG: 30S ribosomal protein S6 [Candidatus Yanofskybacteria bacterium GW2011_GWF1_44_227]OGN35583.1 MAG: hypothetical protein A2207_02490 [Candidatus Yanofskybacteria bacterium RIFOXYA1_FULL_44_17]OGN36712.1 MAG: hypothetical protein A2241_02890 [Candidatus Yanofskybacteria bacterium RIFOXYA2_FULL_4
MKEDSQNYELAFHMTPDLEESKIPEARSAIEGFVTSNGANITLSKEPVRTRLSYPVLHHKGSYFGYMHFSTKDGEMLNNLNEFMKADVNVFRYLIVKLPSDKQRSKTIARQQKARERFEKREQVKVPEKDSKQLDEQLETIIENL